MNPFQNKDIANIVLQNINDSTAYCTFRQINKICNEVADKEYMERVYKCKVKEGYDMDLYAYLLKMTKNEYIEELNENIKFMMGYPDEDAY